VRTKSFSLLVPLFALGACITNSEVGKFYSSDDGTPQQPATGAAADAGGDTGTDGAVIETPPLSPARVRIAAGAASTCALESGGRVICWGDNEHGQLGVGDSTILYSSQPWIVPDLDIGIDAVFGGGFAHCALRKDGRVACWGDAVFEQSSSGVYSHSVTYAPTEVPELTEVATVAIGVYFQCALTIGKSTKCYGLNSAGQLGNRTFNDTYDPVEVSGIGNEGRFLAAAQSGYFACAITTAGALKCWGANVHGQLGNGSRDGAKEAAAVTGLDANVTAVAAGSDHACAIVSGSVQCWGSNSEGQLGDGTNDEQLVPKPVAGLPTITALTAGNGHTCALSDAGAVYCWGNYQGNSGSLTPVRVIDAGVTEIVAGGRHMCALYSDSVLQCWGANDRGQLGPFSGGGASL